MSNLLGPRDANGIPVPMTVDESIASMKVSLLKKSNVLPTFTAWTAAAATAAKLKFSLPYRRCSMQSASALKLCRLRVMRIFYYLPARSPVQCDPLRCVRGSPRRTRKSVSPTVPAVTAAGSSTISTACGGTDKIVPVDVYIPGCPPTPAATLYGFAMALGLLEQKIHARGPGELDEQPAEILHGDMVQPLRVKVDREARRLAGYRYGRQIADDFLTQLGQGEEQVARWLEAENDPRLNEIVSHLNHVVEEARIR